MKVRLWFGKDLSHSRSLCHPKAMTFPFHVSMFICKARRCSGSEGLDQGNLWRAWGHRQNSVFMCRFAFFLFLKRGIHGCHQFFKGTVAPQWLFSSQATSPFCSFQFPVKARQAVQEEPVTHREGACSGWGRERKIPPSGTLPGSHQLSGNPLTSQPVPSEGHQSGAGGWGPQAPTVTIGAQRGRSFLRCI